MLELHSIRNLRERIDTREVANPLFGAASLCNVLRSVDSIARFGFFAPKERTRIRNWNRFAELALKKCFTRQPRRRVANKTSTFPGIGDEVDRCADEFTFLIAEQVRRRLVDAFDPALIP
jgi:hypothetical protein